MPQTILDPATCGNATGARVCPPFPNKQITLNRIVGPAAVLFKDASLYPLPNSTGTGTLGVLNNYSGSAASFLTNNQGDAKLDWRASTNDNFMFRYTQSYYTVGTPRPVLPTSASGVTESPSLGAVAYNLPNRTTFSPRRAASPRPAPLASSQARRIILAIFSGP